MSISSQTQIDPSSVDTVGLSVFLTPATSSNARNGLVYDPTTWAAAAPVWMHPLHNGSWLVCCAQRWYSATVNATTVGSYSAYSVDTKPSWFIVTPPSGGRTAVPGVPLDIPMNTTATSPVLVAGASYANNILFLLTSATVAGTPTAVLQRFNLGINGSVALAQEDVLPAVGGVVFNAGLHIRGNNIVVYGTSATHQVYKVTKPWGHVGVNATINPTIKKYTEPGLMTPQGWQYFTGTGYSASSSGLGPVTVKGGAALTSYAPLSFADYRNQTLMSTVTNASGTYSSAFWTSKSGLPFTSIGTPAVLGSSANVIGGVQLQNNLAPNPTNSAMTAAGVISGIPYVTSAVTSVTGGTKLANGWGILPIKP